MNYRTLIVAPHPDDEFLGCGGTILRRKAEGAEVAWLIVTDMSGQFMATPQRVDERDSEISRIAELVGFNNIFNLRFPTTQLDKFPMADVVNKFASVFNEFQPNEVFVPHRSDIHTDHRVVFDAVAACTKWFRYPSVHRVLAYETLSETDMALNPSFPFQPNVFIDISNFIDQKLDILKIYKSELGDFPFPRSREALCSLSKVRGAASGFYAAEAFQLLRERQ